MFAKFADLPSSVISMCALKAGEESAPYMLIWSRTLFFSPVVQTKKPYIQVHINMHVKLVIH